MAFLFFSSTLALFLLWTFLAKARSALFAESCPPSALHPRHHLISDNEDLASTVLPGTEMIPRGAVDVVCDDQGPLSDKGPKRTNHTPVAIIFKAYKQIQSPPMPLPPSKEHTLDDFFGSKEYVNVQFSKNAKVEEVENPSKSMMESFRQLHASRRVEAGLPPEEDYVSSIRIVRLVNPPMRCLGLTLHSVTNVGVHLFKGYREDTGQPNENREFPGYPELQFTMLDSHFEATGPKPLVGLFHKIMGGGGNDDTDDGGSNNRNKKKEPMETIGLTRIFAEPARNDDNNADAVVFTERARLESHIRVPKLLMKLMPMSQKRLEEKGSATIQNAIEKDMYPAMDRFTDAYKKWVESLSSSS